MTFGLNLLKLVGIIDQIHREGSAEHNKMVSDSLVYSVRLASDLMAVDGDVDKSEIIAIMTGVDDLDAKLLDVLKLAMKTQYTADDKTIPMVLAEAIQLDKRNGSNLSGEVIDSFVGMSKAVLIADGDYDRKERAYFERVIEQWINNCVSRGVTPRLSN